MFQSKDVWSGSGVDTTTAVLYAGAAAVALSSLLYTFGPLLPSFSTTPTKSVKKKVTAPKVEVSAPATPSALEKEEEKGQESAPLKKEEEGTLVQETDDKKVSKSVKSRRKRASTPRNQAQVSSWLISHLQIFWAAYKSQPHGSFPRTNCTNLSLLGLLSPDYINQKVGVIVHYNL